MDRLKSDIQGTDHQPEALARLLFDLLERNHGYAEATGVSYFFVLTVCDLGHRLLKRHRLGETTSGERKEFACTVLSGKAADVLEFTPALAA